MSCKEKCFARKIKDDVYYVTCAITYNFSN